MPGASADARLCCWQVWGAARPSAPLSPVTIHPLAFAGASVQSKIEQLRLQIRQVGFQQMLGSGALQSKACSAAGVQGEWQELPPPFPICLSRPARARCW